MPSFHIKQGKIIPNRLSQIEKLTKNHKKFRAKHLSEKRLQELLNSNYDWADLPGLGKVLHHLPKKWEFLTSYFSKFHNTSKFDRL